MKNKLCDIAWNLRQARESRNLTQEYMAVQLNMSTTAYRNIENRYSQLSLNRLFEIADVLNISVAELLELPTPQSLICSHCNKVLSTQPMNNRTDKDQYLLIEKKRLDEITRQLSDLMLRLSHPNGRRKR